MDPATSLRALERSKVPTSALLPFREAPVLMATLSPVFQSKPFAWVTCTPYKEFSISPDCFQVKETQEHWASADKLFADYPGCTTTGSKCVHVELGILIPTSPHTKKSDHSSTLCCNVSNLPPTWVYVLILSFIAYIALLGLWADALHGSMRLIFFLQYIYPYIYNK